MDYKKYNNLNQEYHNGYELFILSQTSPQEVPIEFFQTYIANRSQDKINELILKIFNMQENSHFNWVRHIYENYHSGAELHKIKDSEAIEGEERRLVLNLGEVLEGIWKGKDGFDFSDGKKTNSFLWLLEIELKKRAGENFKLDKPLMKTIRELILFKIKKDPEHSVGVYYEEMKAKDRVINALAKTHLALDIAQEMSPKEKKEIIYYYISKFDTLNFFMGEKTKEKYYKFLSEMGQNGITNMLGAKNVETEYMIEVCKNYTAQNVFKNHSSKAASFINKSGMLEMLKNLCLKRAANSIKAKNSNNEDEMGSIRIAIEYLLMLASWVAAKEGVIPTKSHNKSRDYGYNSPSRDQIKVRQRVESIRWAKAERVFNSFGQEILKAFHIPLGDRSQTLLKILDLAKEINNIRTPLFTVKSKINESEEIAREQIAQTLALGINLRKAKMMGFISREQQDGSLRGKFKI